MIGPKISSGCRHEECDGRDEQEGERVQNVVAPIAEVVRAHAGFDGVARHLLRHAVVQLRAAVVRHR